MTDRWYYQHAGQAHGPTTAAELRRLAEQGQLDPGDLVWPEGDDPSRGVPARDAVGLPEQASASDMLDWLQEVEIPAPGPAAKGTHVAVPRPTAPGTQKRPAIPLPMASGPCRLAVGSSSSRGMVRPHNEDSLLVQQLTWFHLDRRHDLALVVLADGVGGQEAGERASGLTIRTMGHALAPVLAGALAGRHPDATAAAVPEAIGRAFEEANRAVLQATTDDPACKGMGATAVALLVWDGQAYIGLAGDCRVYHHRGGQLAQVTRDQTLVARMVDLGQLSPEEAARHPARNDVLQAVGKHPRIEPAHYELKLARGDYLVVASDGLHAHVDTDTLRDALGQPHPSAAHLANQLVVTANQRGGSDNCTVVVLYCY